MNTLLGWLGGKKLGLCVLAFLFLTALYVLGLALEWDGKALTADHWCNLTWKIILFAVVGNAAGMGIHAFARNKVGSNQKKEE